MAQPVDDARSSSSKTLSKVDVILLALSATGRSDSPADTEDVAVAAHDLAPGSFSWKKYPDQIDLDSVRVTLYDACKEKYGGLARGSVAEGWLLTPAGIRWLEMNESRIRNRLGISAPVRRFEARAEGRHAAMEVSRLRRSEAFRTWLRGDAVSPRIAATAFRIDAYTTEQDRVIKLNRMITSAADVDDSDVRLFIDDVGPRAMEYRPPTPSSGEG